MNTTLNTGGDLISQVNGQYFYYININYDLMRIDMVSEDVVLIAESVQDFTFKNGMIIYIMMSLELCMSLMTN